MRERFGAQKLKTRLPSAEMFPRKSEKKRPQVSTVAGVFNYFRSLSFFFPRDFLISDIPFNFSLFGFGAIDGTDERRALLIFFLKKRFVRYRRFRISFVWFFFSAFSSRFLFVLGFLKTRKRTENTKKKQVGKQHVRNDGPNGFRTVRSSKQTKVGKLGNETEIWN